MENSLLDCSGSSPGPENITYEMIKNLTNLAKNHLLNFYNNLWMQNTFPDDFRKAILIPILKPGKDNKNPESFRPIALTNCLCKLIERMVNKRLVWMCERNNLIRQYQSGFRKFRSTTDNLVYFESNIMEAFAENKHLLSIFFDLEK